MPRVMYDSTNPVDIPISAAMVAGYIDGAFAWPVSGWARFRGKPHVRITVGSGTLDADVADVENGDYDPRSGAAWAARKIARDHYAGLYFSLGLWPQVQAALRAESVDFGLVQVWVADWDGRAQLQPGWVAKQYTHPPASGGHYDVSIVSDYWSGVDPAPNVAPPPSPPGPPEHEVALAWAALGDVLGSVLPGLNNNLAATAGLLGDL